MPLLSLVCLFFLPVLRGSEKSVMDGEKTEKQSDHVTGEAISMSLFQALRKL